MKYDVVLNYWPNGQTLVEVISYGEGRNMKLFLRVPFRKLKRDLANRGKYHKPIGFIIEMEDQELDGFLEAFQDKRVGEIVFEKN